MTPFTITITESGLTKNVTINGLEPEETTPNALYRASELLQSVHQDLVHQLGMILLESASLAGVDINNHDELKEFTYGLTQ